MYRQEAGSIYDVKHKIEVASFSAPRNGLRIKEISKLFPLFLNYKSIRKYYVNLAEVKIEPVKLPKIPPTFTAQYPIKGGMAEISDTVQILLKEGIIEQAQSFHYNSPVWPILKPNGKYRFTVDYRRINGKSPRMPGNLPDVEDIFLQIRQYAPKWLATIDSTDMFFGILLHPESQEITTFTWQNKQYRFKRLPQGYLNSPIIAHATLMTTLETLPEVKGKILSYVDDVLIIGQLKEDVTETLRILVQHLRDNGWTINMDKIQGPAQQVKFLGVHWSTDGPKIPDNVIDKIQALEPPKNKAEVQHIIGIFGYWRQHIPYLQLILQPLYKIIRKSEDFMWQKEQEEALKTCQEYVKEFSIYLTFQNKFYKNQH